MGVISPEGKVFDVPGLHGKKLVEYLKMNYIVDSSIDFDKLLELGWIFYRHFDDEVEVVYRDDKYTRKIINQTFGDEQFNRICLNSPYNTRQCFMKYNGRNEE